MNLLLFFKNIPKEKEALKPFFKVFSLSLIIFISLIMVLSEAQAATQIYRSVSNTTSTLATATTTAGNNLSVSSSIATFDYNLPDNIGVGDAIQYDSDNNGTIDSIAFIHGRSSSTVYTVRNAAGGTPTSTLALDQDWSVYRAYTSLYNAEEGSENTSINATVRNFDTWSNGKDLATSDEVWNIAAYGSGTVDTIPVTIEGWTTASSTYIRIYTPTSTFEVGVSQRHNGKWDSTKYNLSPTVTADFVFAFWVKEEYVRIDGIQISITATEMYLYNGGICISSVVSGTSDIRLSNLIVKGILSDSAFPSHGFWNSGPAQVKIWNSIFYDFSNDISSGESVGLKNAGVGSTTAYNITVQNSNTGLYRSDGTFLVKNVLAYNNKDNYFGTFDASSTNNLSGPTQTDAPGSNPRNNVTVTFVDEANDDFHLASQDTAAINQGTNLSSDPNLSFSDDIDGQSRSGTWDISADEGVFNTVPNTPTSLGPASSTDGSWTASTSPGLTFSLSDPDTADTVKYQIQIATSSSFSSLTIDYTSATSTQGSRSFIVGQAADNGSYTTGSQSQTLTDGSYYWRVMTYDNSNATSSWATANSGSIAFKVDTTAPTGTTLSWGTISASTITISATSTDAGSGLHSLPFYYEYDENATSSFGTADGNSGWTASTTYTFSSLKINSPYIIRVTVRDTVPNSSSPIYASTSIYKYTLANSPSSLSLTADSQNQITASWSNNSNPSGTQYYAENTTTNTNSGWMTDVFSWVSSGLTCSKNYYFRVKARNSDNTEIDSETPNLPTVTCGGSASPPEAYYPPKIPSSTPENPQGGFRILINPLKTQSGELISSQLTNKPLVTLKLFASPDIRKMVIANFSDFRNTGPIPYQSEIQWNLTNGYNSPLLIPDYQYMVYVKFYTAYDQLSPVISETITAGSPGVSAPFVVLTPSVVSAQISVQIENVKTEIKVLCERLIPVLNELIRVLEEKISEILQERGR